MWYSQDTPDVAQSPRKSGTCMFLNKSFLVTLSPSCLTARMQATPSPTAPAGPSCPGRTRRQCSTGPSDRCSPRSSGGRPEMPPEWLSTPCWCPTSPSWRGCCQCRGRRWVLCYSLLPAQHIEMLMHHIDQTQYDILYMVQNMLCAVQQCSTWPAQQSPHSPSPHVLETVLAPHRLCLDKVSQYVHFYVLWIVQLGIFFFFFQ